jgi:hypothetical protein
MLLIRTCQGISRKREVCALSSRLRLIITCALLMVSLGCTAFAARASLGAYQNFQKQSALAKEGDVSTIRPWMTIPYIAHSYNIPESYLYQTLHLASASPSRHVTLHALATRSKRPVQQIIHQVQEAILAYRKQHPHATPAPRRVVHFLNGQHTAGGAPY